MFAQCPECGIIFLLEGVKGLEWLYPKLLGTYFIYLTGEESSRPKRRAHTRALRLLGDVSISGDVKFIPKCPSICSRVGSGASAAGPGVSRGCSHGLCAAGFGCHTGRGWRGMSIPRISASHSTTVTVSCDSTGRAGLCHWTLSRGVCTE